MSALLSSRLQRDVFGVLVILAKRKHAAGKPRGVTTREISAELDRVGQPIGHACGALADKGVLARSGARGRYLLGERALDAAAELDGWSWRGERVRRRR